MTCWSASRKPSLPLGWAVELGRRTPGHGRAVRDRHVRRHVRYPLAGKLQTGFAALAEKQEGELVELEGQWEKGKGEIPAALFDPQFASIGTD